MSRLLTLDVGGTSAFFVGEFGGSPLWGHKRFTPVKRGVFISEAEIDWTFGLWVTELIDEFRPDILGIENPWIPRKREHLTNTVFRIIAMSRMGCAIAYGNGLEVRRRQIAEVAEFHGTSGMPSAAKKAATNRHLREAYGWEPLTLDESDAGAVWLLIEAEEEPDLSGDRGVGPLLRPEVMALKKGRAKKPVKEPELQLI